MKRDIYKSLIDWKNSSRRKPLVLNGARQVGKTYALKHFGKECYKNCVYLNFEKDELLSKYFETTLEPRELLRVISIHKECEIIPNETLLIFDEIQSCPRALSSLKYFCEEANDFHVASAGSLLGVKTAGEKGFPVGKVNFLNLYPLTFFEFLEVSRHEKLREYLEEYKSFEPLPIPLHEQLLNLLRLYFYIGGMPEAVAEYIKSEKLNLIREIQEEILSAYEKDFIKHAPAQEVMKITTVWHQIHSQLAKENKKFIFSAIRKSARGRDFEESLQWLLDAGLIHKSYLVETPKFPLSAYRDNNIFKIFLLDVGLLGAKSHLSLKIILEGNRMFQEFKGALTENFVASELIARASQKPYYWASTGIAEVDFLIEDEHKILPLEVKSGESGKKKSLLVFGEKYNEKTLLKTTTMNLTKNGSIYNFPLYMVGEIPRLINPRLETLDQNSL